MTGDDTERLEVPTFLRREAEARASLQTSTGPSPRMTARKIMRVAILQTALAQWRAVLNLRHATSAERELAELYVNEIEAMIVDAVNR